MARVPVPIYAFVLVIVENGGHYVLVQEAKPERGYSWYLPAGGVKPGKGIVEATRRETLEEAGLLVEPRYLLRIEHEMPRWQQRQNPVPERWRFVVAASVTGGTLKAVGDKHSLRAGWFRPEQLQSLNLRSHEVVELIEAHRRGGPWLPIEAYVPRTY